eukprot:gene16782-biopygen8462
MYTAIILNDRGTIQEEPSQRWRWVMRVRRCARTPLHGRPPRRRQRRHGPPARTARIELKYYDYSVMRPPRYRQVNKTTCAHANECERSVLRSPKERETHTQHTTTPTLRFLISAEAGKKTTHARAPDRQTGRQEAARRPPRAGRGAGRAASGCGGPCNLGSPLSLCDGGDPSQWLR